MSPEGGEVLEMYDMEGQNVVVQTRSEGKEN